MKKLLLLLFSVFVLISCSKDEELIPNSEMSLDGESFNIGPRTKRKMNCFNVIRIIICLSKAK